MKLKALYTVCIVYFLMIYLSKMGYDSSSHSSHFSICTIGNCQVEPHASSFGCEYKWGYLALNELLRSPTWKGLPLFIVIPLIPVVLRLNLFKPFLTFYLTNFFASPDLLVLNVDRRDYLVAVAAVGFIVIPTEYFLQRPI